MTQEREREKCQEKHAVLTSSNKKEAWGYFQPKVRDYVWNKTLRDQRLNPIFFLKIEVEYT